MMKSKNFGIVLVTASSEEEAHQIASKLIESQLAACVTFCAITSVYRWENKLHCDDEWQLTIKTDLTKFDLLTATVKEIHSYEVPEIIAIPIVKGADSYLQWMEQELTNDD